MKKRPSLGVITVVPGILSLSFLVYFVSQYQPPFLHWVVLEKTTMGALAFAGGVLLWRGKVWGYWLSLIAWVLVIATSLASLISWYRTPNIAETLTTTWLSKDIILILVAVLMIYVLGRDLVRVTTEKPPH